MPDTADIAAEIARLYPAVHALLHARRDKHESRPSPEALAVMAHLSLSGPLTVGEAARHFDRAQSAVSELIDRIEAHGWVARSPDGRDRRRTLVWLTDAGLAVLQRSREVLSRERLDAAVARLAPAERDALVAGLRALVAAAHDLPTEGTRE